jgi:hypothetical protein
MKTRLISSAVLCAFAIVASTAVAQPVKLSKAQMDNVVAGTITPGTTTQTNGGGNTPQGNANGVPTTTTPATNPAGKAPPGQN